MIFRQLPLTSAVGAHAFLPSSAHKTIISLLCRGLVQNLARERPRGARLVRLRAQHLAECDPRAIRSFLPR